MLSNEGKTLEQITTEELNEPVARLEVSEEVRGFLVGAMLTMGIGELRINDGHLESRAVLEVRRDIHRRCAVFTLVGADRAGMIR